MPTHPSPLISNLNDLGAALGIDLSALVVTPAGSGIPDPGGEVSGDALIWSGSAWASGKIADANVSATANIARSKLGALSIVNADVSNGAGIVYSKLSLANSIQNADVAGAAAIAYSKLALTGSVVNADIASGAAIAVSKVAPGSNGQILTTTGGAAAWTTVSSAGNVLSVYNVKTDYGAAGDGSTNDTTAVQNAINAANAAGGGIVYFPPGTYFISTTLTIKSFVQLLGAGIGISTIKMSDTNASTLITGASLTTANATTLSAQANAGDRTISVTSATGIAFGDYYQISGNTRHFVSRVAAINGTAITLEEKIPFVIPNGTATARITAWGSEHWSMRDLSFIGATSDPTTQTTRLSGVVKTNGAKDVLIEDCEFTGIANDSGPGIVSGDTSLNVHLHRLKFYNCYDSNPTPTQNSKMTYFVRVINLIETEMMMRRSGGSKTSGHAQCTNVLYCNNVIGGESDWGGFATTTTTGTQSFPLAGSTLNVTSTTGFLLSGTNKAWLALGSPPYTTNPTAITYTGGTGTTLTGVSGPGSGSIPAGSTVTATPTSYVAGSEVGLPADSGGRGVSWEDWCCNWVCNNNVFHDTGFDGIRADGGLNGTICGNIIFASRDVPIYCTSGNGSSVSSNILIANNQIYFSGNNTNVHGIGAAGGASELVIIGNRIANSPSQGIYLTANNIDCIVSDNIIDTCTSQGIRLDAGCIGNQVKGNKIRNTTAAAIRTVESGGGNYVMDNDVGTAASKVDINVADYFRPLIQRVSASTNSYQFQPVDYVAVDLSFTAAGAPNVINPVANRRSTGMETTIAMKNTSGGALTPVFGTTFLLQGGAAPSIGAGKYRVFRFFDNGTNLIESYRSAADI